MRRLVAVSLVVLLAPCGCAAPAHTGSVPAADPAWKPEIPRVWVDAEMGDLEIPLAEAAISPKHVPADYYYRIPVRPIFKTYPVYAPDREPPGYIERLKRLEPEIVFDASRLETQQDWIRAGEIVFDAPITTGRLGSFVPNNDLYVRNPEWHRRARIPVAGDGTLPFFRYVVSQKGKVEVGILACGMCHTRLMPDGSVIKGAQGNFPIDWAIAADFRELDSIAETRIGEKFLYGMPGGDSRPENQFYGGSVDEMAALHEAIPPGVAARHRTNPISPVQIPDLIGVKDRRYLDRTGLQRHRSLADLMRYAALNQGGDDLASFGDFTPVSVFFDGKRPDPGTQTRYSDEQLYALALFLYSLAPPPNPNRFDAVAAQGQKVFEREKCGGCHTPPLFTNNGLTPAVGFALPDEHRRKYDIVTASVGTDPTLTMKTRRGTGYYKVPSLKGVWYRGPFEHSGSVATLEEWFDPRRLRDDFVSGGFRGHGVKSRAVPGHPFGLKLSAEDRQALVAFLRTL